MTDNLSPTVCPAGSGFVEAISLPPWHRAEGLLKELLVSSVIRRYDWDHLEESIQETLLEEFDDSFLLNDLVSLSLLTDYQAERIRSGQRFGLVLGHYRVLNPLGHGAMGQVYKAEHIRLPRLLRLKCRPYQKMSNLIYCDDLKTRRGH